MKLSLFLLGSVLLGAACALHCDEHNFLQWSCYTVSDEPSEPTTLSGLATKLHVNPQRLADFNSMADQALALVPRGHMLRVPYLGAACMPQPGLWGCHEVAKTGETIQAVAASSASFWRSAAGVTAAEQVNSRAMHGESAALYVGMHVRMPIAECIPTIDQACKLVGEDRNLSSFASLYDTTAAVLLEANADVLAGDTTVHPGMVLKVPLVNPTPPSPCVDNEQWGCVTVVQGDTLTTIAETKAVDPNNLCTWNGVSNCSLIEIGQVLAFPKQWVSNGLVGCEIIPGLIPACYTNVGKYPHYLNNVPPLYSPDPATSQRFNALNAFITPSDMARGYSAEIWPEVTVRVPGRRCMPTHDYDCVSIDDWTRAMNPPDDRPFSQDGYIRYIDENRWWLNEQYEGMLVQWPHDAPAPHAVFDTCTFVNSWCAAGEPTPSSGADYSYCPQAAIVPGKQFAYKVRFNDTLDDLDARFGFKQGELCAYNGIKNCSCLSTDGAWLAIPNVANP